jgi:RNA polymerase sigma-70 factor, ECF subfamily
MYNRAGVARGRHGAELDEETARLLDEARARFPGLEVADARFAERVAAARQEAEGTALLGPELYLTTAAGDGSSAAVAFLAAEYLGAARTAVARMNLGDARADDALQIFRDRLFVRDGVSAPKILDYGGRGDLRGWLRVGAVRQALKVVRGERREIASDDERIFEEGAGAARDPELDQMKALYQPAFKRAFQAALASLPDREKNLLRQSAIDGLSIDDLAALYRVHRATCARWLEGARQTLFSETRRQLVEEAGIAEAECDSIIRLVQSQLHVTLRRALGGGEPTP